MRPGVIGVSPDTSLRDVARILAGKHIHCVLVNSVEKLGARQAARMISALDLLSAAVDEAFEDRTAADLAAKALAVSTDAQLEDAARLMAENRVDHLLVIDASDAHPVGVLSTLDVAGIVAWGEA